MKKTLLRLLCLAMMAMMLCSTAALAEAPVDDGVMREGLTSLELTRLMGNGINLGNTMEACNTNTPFVPGEPTSVYETLWGQPVTTQEMIDGMKAMGFDTLRIPVAWMTNATSLRNDGDYIIEQAYLDRVKEIVDYARKADMYVIINDHWDGGWYGMFGSEDPATRQLAMDAYTGMWAQVAMQFADYSDYVIFESANEELGARFDENSPYCDDSVVSYFNDAEKYALCNAVNQAFVDTIRATGGNNENRFLLIAGYGTNVYQTCDDRFVMPTDTAVDKLLVSVHCYSPTTYCLANSSASATPWGLKSHYASLEEELSQMAKFTSQGIGVVIGEYGALPQADGLKPNTLEYHTLILDLFTKYDMTSCLWDCSGLYLRRELKPADADIAALYQSRNAASEVGTAYADIQAEAAAAIAAAAAAAPDTFNDDALVVTADTAVAWIMWNDGGYQISYSVGDTYTPDSKTPGLVVTDAEITGPGTYTIGLDFTGTAQGYSASIAFAAIGIGDGELLFPGYVIDIKKVEINGEKYNLKGRPYTTSDDGKCTRVNLFNEWVPTPPYDKARMHGGNTAGITAMPINRSDAPIAQIKTIYITFDYAPQR